MPSTDQNETKPPAWSGGKCRVPMFSGSGFPDGFCDAEAFGPQYPARLLQQQRGWGDRSPYCFGPCCPAHGGPRDHEPRVFQDGHTEQGRPMWCAVNPDFNNLQESPAGFSGDPVDAVALLAQASKAEAA